MTCIVGLSHEGYVWLGGDRVWSDDNGTMRGSQPKLWEQKGIVWGACGNDRPAQVLRYHCNYRERRPEEDPFQYLVREVVGSIAETMELNGNPQLPDKDQGTDGATFVLVHGGELYHLDSQLGLFKTADEFLSVGSCPSMAIGALSAYMGCNQDPFQAIKWTLRTCTKFNDGVGPPFDVWRTDKEGQTIKYLVQE